MSKKLSTRNGKVTDIFHSYPYYTATAKQRRDLAFDKNVLSVLSERDKLLMRGYAQAKVEEVQAFRYKNPNYKRNGRNPRTSTSSLKKHFYI